MDSSCGKLSLENFSLGLFRLGFSYGNFRLGSFARGLGNWAIEAGGNDFLGVGGIPFPVAGSGVKTLQGKLNQGKIHKDGHRTNNTFSGCFPEY